MSSDIIHNLSNTSEVIKSAMIELAEWIDGAGKTIENTHFAVMVVKEIQSEQKEQYRKKVRNLTWQ